MNPYWDGDTTEGSDCPWCGCGERWAEDDCQCARDALGGMIEDYCGCGDAALAEFGQLQDAWTVLGVGMRNHRRRAREGHRQGR